MTLKSKLRGKASAKNIVLGIATLTLFCTIIAQCSLTIKMHQCVGSGDAESCRFSGPLGPMGGHMPSSLTGPELTNHTNAINGLAIFNLIMVLLLPSVQVVLKNV